MGRSLNDNCVLHKEKMEFLKRFDCFHFFNASAPLKLMRTDFLAAGCIFTDGNLILAGYQPTKLAPIISGLGGKREGDEFLEETAIRETVEELFEIKTLPSGLVQRIERDCVPRKILQNGAYGIIVYNFKDLDKILRICSSYKIVSPLYTKFPRTLDQLLFGRLQGSLAEVTHLALLPFVSEQVIDPSFIEDMQILLRNP